MSVKLFMGYFSLSVNYKIKNAEYLLAENGLELRLGMNLHTEWEWKIESFLHMHRFR